MSTHFVLSRFYTINKFERSAHLNFGFYKFEWSIHLMYTIFSWIFTILYFQGNQISQQVQNICTSNVHNFPLNFHNMVCSLILNQIFTHLYIQRIRIFLQIRMIYTSNVHNFQLNVHDFVLSTKTNLSTSLDYLYI